jgi:uncharacterized protein YndB with AHSA1/START domain
MENNAPPAPPPEVPKKKRIVGRLLLAASAVLLIVFVVRGTWTDSEPKNPTSSADRTVTQLFRTPEGRTQIRCARLMDVPIADVWRAVTDYPHFPEMFPTVKAAMSVRDPDGRFHVVLEVDTPLGRWPVDVRITHEEGPEKRVASWDEPTGSITTNRGSWTLSPAGPDKTLVVYALEVEIRRYPNFLVRNVLLSRQKSVLNSFVDAVMKQRGSGK